MDIRGRRVELRESDILLTLSPNWRARVVSWFNGNYSHCSIVISLGGELVAVQSNARGWKSASGLAMPPGVVSQPLADALQDRHCLRLAIVRPSPALTADELAHLKLWLVDALRAQQNSRESLYDAGLDLALAPLGCCPAITSRKFVCSELLARALHAAGRWPSGTTLVPRLPVLARSVGGRIVRIF